METCNEFVVIIRTKHAFVDRQLVHTLYNGPVYQGRTQNNSTMLKQNSPKGIDIRFRSFWALFLSIVPSCHPVCSNCWTLKIFFHFKHGTICHYYWSEVVGRWLKNVKMLACYLSLSPHSSMCWMILFNIILLNNLYARIVRFKNMHL